MDGQLLELLPWNSSLNQESSWQTCREWSPLNRLCLLFAPPSSRLKPILRDWECALQWQVKFTEKCGILLKFLLGIWEWGSWLKVCIKDILGNKKGKEAETNLNILTGMQHLPTTLITSRIYGFYCIQLFPGFTGENVGVKLKMTLTHGVITVKKKIESHSTWLPNLWENTVHFTCSYLIVYSPKISFAMTPSWGF